MSEVKSNSTILDLADKLRDLLPEFKRRIIAVSEMEVNRSNVPSFPIGMLALQDINYVHFRETNKPTEIQETIVVEFWFASNKITQGDKESPFWSYYDYDPLQDRFVDFILDYRSPRGWPVQLMRMDLESSEIATMLTFVLQHRYDHCKAPQEPLMILGKKNVGFKMTIPTKVCDDC
jgi:hypothetical protein